MAFNFASELFMYKIVNYLVYGIYIVGENCFWWCVGGWTENVL